jgi:hypothetical protein
MMKVTPKTPIRASHRVLLKLLKDLEEGDKTDPKPEELDKISQSFKRAGGSWERIFHGSVEDFILLQDMAEKAMKEGLLTKKSRWK